MIGPALYGASVLGPIGVWALCSATIIVAVLFIVFVVRRFDAR